MIEKKYLIIPTSELKKVDFTKVLESSPDTLHYNGNGKKTFIKWINKEPDFIGNLKNTEGPYNHYEIQQILKSDDWIAPSSKKSTKKVT